MEAVIFGLWPDAQINLSIEIYMYLLTCSFFLMVTGRTLHREIGSMSYIKQIRYGKRRIWWHRLGQKVVGLNFLLVTALFLLVRFCEGDDMAMTVTQWGTAYLLWQWGWITMSLVQMMIVDMPGGYKWSFFVGMGIVILSLILPHSPGSFWMYRRSEMAWQDGYSIGTVILGESVLSIMIYTVGYRIGRGKK
jgi:hypothetical protein